MFQWLGLHIPSAGCPGSIPGQETRSHMPQLRVHMLQLTPSIAKYIEIHILKGDFKCGNAFREF